MATLPGAWCYRVSAGTGWLGVSILWLGVMECLICNFCLGVAACKIVWADPSLRYTRMLLERSATNQLSLSLSLVEWYARAPSAYSTLSQSLVRPEQQETGTQSELTKSEQSGGGGGDVEGRARWELFGTKEGRS